MTADWDLGEYFYLLIFILIFLSVFLSSVVPSIHGPIDDRARSMDDGWTLVGRHALRASRSFIANEEMPACIASIADCMLDAYNTQVTISNCARWEQFV